MTIQYDPRPAIPHGADATTRRRPVRRWAIPAGFVAVTAVAVIGVVRIPGGTQAGSWSVNDPASQVDMTKAQVLVQRSIDEAVAGGQLLGEFTGAQVLVQRSIDEAVAGNDRL
jgi:hypothetical protein